MGLLTRTWNSSYSPPPLWGRVREGGRTKTLTRPLPLRAAKAPLELSLIALSPSRKGRGERGLYRQ
jgi:hypothetical protein